MLLSWITYSKLKSRQSGNVEFEQNYYTSILPTLHNQQLQVQTQNIQIKVCTVEPG